MLRNMFGKHPDNGTLLSWAFAFSASWMTWLNSLSILGLDLLTQPPLLFDSGIDAVGLQLGYFDVVGRRGWLTVDVFRQGRVLVASPAALAAGALRDD